MSDETEIHEVVQLLLARMESHPEEFDYRRAGDDAPKTTDPYRWDRFMQELETVATDEEWSAIRAGIRKLRMEGLHAAVIDELVNGDERREKERLEREAGEQRWKLQQQQILAQQLALYNGYGNAASALGSATASAAPQGLLGRIKGLIP